jgi:ADP-ribose pyrophosphatase YjhB (NUDIX family)
MTTSKSDLWGGEPADQSVAPRVGPVPIPAFIETLRTKIGHDLLWLSGVSGVVVDETGRLLLTRRADSGRWAVPSGIVEPGEQPATALAREIAEETGVIVEVERLVSVMSLEPKVCPNGDLVQFLDLTFACRYVSGQARVCDDENLDVGWFEHAALPEMGAGDLRRVRQALSREPVTFFQP